MNRYSQSTFRRSFKDRWKFGLKAGLRNFSIKKKKKKKKYLREKKKKEKKKKKKKEKKIFMGKNKIGWSRDRKNWFLHGIVRAQSSIENKT